MTDLNLPLVMLSGAASDFFPPVGNKIVDQFVSVHKFP